MPDLRCFQCRFQLKTAGETNHVQELRIRPEVFNSYLKIAKLPKKVRGFCS